MCDVTSVCYNKPDIEGNGHHRVEHNDIGPEGEEGGESGINPWFTREEGCEH